MPVWFLCACLLGMPLPVEAAPLALEALVDVAVARHPAITAARAHAAAAAAQAAAARAPYWPQVSGEAATALTTNVSPSQTAAQPFQLSAAGVQLRQQLFDFGRTAQRAAEADAQAAAWQGEVEIAMVEAACATRRAYFDWARARAEARAAEDGFQAASVVYRQALAFWEAGRRPKIEAVRIEADREAARGDLALARSAAEGARRALAASLALDEIPAGEPVFSGLPALVNQPLVDLVARAMTRHPALVAAAWQAEAGTARAHAAARSGWPELVADASYGVRVRDASPAPLWSSGVSLSLPLFTGYALTRRWEAARAEAEAAAALQAERARRVRLEVEQAYWGLRGARDRRPAAAARFRAARETWRLALRRYRDGVGQAVELTDARALWGVAEVAEVRAEAELHRAVAELWRALGETGRERSLSPP
ncbi:MAG: TolC family protein [Candidatus Sericytochromatia bacterium]|nr:TolC family protein [Candidatus Sericytochromatia bacterium]